MKLKTMASLVLFTGLGIYIGKKVMQYKQSQPANSQNQNCCCPQEEMGDKLRKASMFAVGTLKTGKDKLNEVIQEAVTQDMVQKGEDATQQILNKVDELKSKVTNIGKSQGCEYQDFEYDDLESETESFS